MGLEDTWQNVILLGEMSIEYLPNRGCILIGISWSQNRDTCLIHDVQVVVILISR